MSKRFLAILITVVLIFTLSGCNDYREVEDMSLVTGFAIDKGEKQRYSITAEIDNLRDASKDKTAPPLYITTEGNTVLDTLRNMIKLSGNKLYVGHCNSIIISQQIAKELGVSSVIDYVMSDSEPPLYCQLFISMEDSAKELFDAKTFGSVLKGIAIEDIMDSNENLSKAIRNRIPDVANMLAQEGRALVLPGIGIDKTQKEPSLASKGTAILKNDRLVGFIDCDNTKNLLFVLNKVKTAILPVKDVLDQSSEKTVTFEIDKSKTTVKPKIDGDNVSIDINIKTSVMLDAQESDINYDKAYNAQILEKEIEKELKESIEKTIKSVQDQFDADIFDFSGFIQRSDIQFWKKISKDWDKIFKSLKVNVNADITAINSALTQKPLLNNK